MREVGTFEERVDKVESESCDSTLISDLKEIAERLAAVNSCFEASTDAGSQSDHEQAAVALSKSAKKRARKAARDAAHKEPAAREAPVAKAALRLPPKLVEASPALQAEAPCPAMEPVEVPISPKQEDAAPTLQKGSVAATVPKQAQARVETAKPRAVLSHKSEVMVPASSFGALIGKDGLVIRSIKEKLGVQIDMPWVSRDDAGTHAVRIRGATRTSVSRCEEVIRYLVQYHHHELTHPGQTHAEVKVPSWAHRHIIGAGGSELRRIQNQWSVKLHLPEKSSSSERLLIVGLPDDVAQAVAHVRQLVGQVEQSTATRG
jgi:transcription antitermination factor NusA-like protein